jgi:hypothetical protein
MGESGNSRRNVRAAGTYTIHEQIYDARRRENDDEHRHNEVGSAAAHDGFDYWIEVTPDESRQGENKDQDDQDRNNISLILRQVTYS